MPYHTYIIYSASKGRYYTGSCEDLAIRLQQHNAGRNVSTMSGVPWVLVYSEESDDRSSATRRETEIKKKKSKKYIEWLIGSAR